MSPIMVIVNLYVVNLFRYKSRPRNICVERADMHCTLALPGVHLIHYYPIFWWGTNHTLLYIRSTRFVLLYCYYCGVPVRCCRRVAVSRPV